MAPSGLPGQGQENKTRPEACARYKFFDPKSPLGRFKFLFDESGKASMMEIIDPYKIVRLNAKRVESHPA
jgi:hypothetical protein